MKKYPYHALVVLFLLSISFNTSAQNIGINTTGTAPSQNAILDLNTGNAYNMGLIIPHVELGSSLSTFSPPIANAATTHDTGMMVYNTNSLYQPIGYYYWNGATWVSVGGGSSSGWGLIGNSGTSPGTNYAGTTDVNAFVIKTHAIERMRFLASGSAGIGTSTPQSSVDINGNMTLGSYAGANAAPANGLIVSGQVGIGTNLPDGSAALDVTSTTTGFLPPRMTALQMAAIASPTTGLIVLNTTTSCLEYWSGTAWQNVSCPCTTAPATPGTITGSTTPCVSSAGNVYSISAVATATSYNWTVPTGAIITANTGTSITVTFATTSGNITVTATNSCGTSAAAILAITLSSTPATPATPSGTTTPIISTANTYTIAAVGGATTYTWSTSNTSLATVTSGQGTTSASITSTAAPGTYTICVTAGNACGTSASSCLTVTSSACATIHSTATFAYTGAAQTWTVPCGISVITITLYGAQGGLSIECSTYYATDPATGGTVVGTLSVTPGTTYSVYVGGGGTRSGSGGLGGYNGGAIGGTSDAGGGGGGATDIRATPYALANRIAVAGGGGGEAYNYGCGTESGGMGGSTTGQCGFEDYTAECGGANPNYAAGGGSQVAGGAGGNYTGYCVGSTGTLGNGGAAGSCGNSGGGGGGGYYGGGGGVWGGGGGGSNYTGGLTTVTTNNQGGGATSATPTTAGANGSATIKY